MIREREYLIHLSNPKDKNYLNKIEEGAQYITHNEGYKICVVNNSTFQRNFIVKVKAVLRM